MPDELGIERRRVGGVWSTVLRSEDDAGGGGVPNGGTTAQVLQKLSATDGDADWESLPFVGTDPPDGPVDGQLWWDTDDDTPFAGAAVTVQTGDPSGDPYSTPLVYDDTAISGGLYGWDGAGYVQIGGLVA